MHPVLTEVTERIQARSAGLREAYVAHLRQAR